MSLAVCHVIRLAWLGFLVCGTALAQSQAQEFPSTNQLHWPQWRGPDWNGVAPDADPPIHWSDTRNLKWKVPVAGEGHGTPIVCGNRIFLQTALALDKELPVPNVIPEGTPNIEVNPDESVVRWKPQRFGVVCLDRESGKPRWTRWVHEAMPHQGHHLKGGFASQSMVTDGERVYAYFGSYGLYCFDLQGTLVWKHAAQPQALEAGLGEGSSPALTDESLILVVDQETQSYIVALDKFHGRELWRTNRDEPSNWSTPRIARIGERTEVIVNGTKVRSYDASNGELIWECGGHTASAIPVPAVGHGLVFNTSGWSRDKLQAIRQNQQGDLTGSEHVVWSLDRGTPYVPSPMLWGDELYLLDDRSFFSCYRATDGQQHFKVRLPGALNFSASPVGAADRIYLASEEGTTVVVQRGPDFRRLATNHLEDGLYASPVIVGRAIFLRGKHHLYCFEREDGEPSCQ